MHNPDAWIDGCFLIALGLVAMLIAIVLGADRIWRRIDAERQ